MSRCRYAYSLRLALPALVAGSAAIAFPASTEGQNSVATRPAVSPYTAYVTEAGARFRLPEDLIWAVMRAESGSDPRARSSAGAMGLMQIMPATWAMLTAKHQLGTDPFDIRANILAGAAYLRAMLDRYGDPGIALAAYNAGPGRVDDWRTGARSLPAETIAYVARIAPATGAPGIASPARGVAVQQDWRSAPLFAPGTDSASNRAITAPDMQPAGAATATISASATPSPLPPNPLFIPLSGQGAP